MASGSLSAQRQSSPRRYGKLDLVAVAFVILCGCTNQRFQDSLSKSSDNSSDAPKLSQKSMDASGASNADEDWNSYGRQMRSDRAATQENDPLKDLFESPRAQEIERSLGVSN